MFIVLKQTSQRNLSGFRTRQLTLPADEGDQTAASQPHRLERSKRPANGFTRREHRTLVLLWVITLRSRPDQDSDVSRQAPYPKSAQSAVMRRSRKCSTASAEKGTLRSSIACAYRGRHGSVAINLALRGRHKSMRV